MGADSYKINSKWNEHHTLARAVSKDLNRPTALSTSGRAEIINPSMDRFNMIELIASH